MTLRHAQWTRQTRQTHTPTCSRDLNGREQTIWSQDRIARNRARHPLARWRMAVTVIVEPLILVIVPLLLWGMIGAASTPLMLAIGLTLGLILLVLGTLVASVLAADAHLWQRDEAR